MRESDAQIVSNVEELFQGHFSPVFEISSYWTICAHIFVDLPLNTPTSLLKSNHRQLLHKKRIYNCRYTCDTAASRTSRILTELFSSHYQQPTMRGSSLLALVACLTLPNIWTTIGLYLISIISIYSCLSCVIFGVSCLNFPEVKYKKKKSYSVYY